MVEQNLVFISHTQEMSSQPEGESYVEGAEDAINAIDGAKARHMEFFPAADMSPADYSIRQLEDADIFLAIVGFQHGSTVPGEERSYTELEFDAATELGKERLLFLLHPSAHEASAADPGQIRFRQRLESSGATVAYFTDVGDLKFKVSQAVTRSLRERTKRASASGGVRAPNLPPVQGRTVGRAVSFAGLMVLSIFLLFSLGVWSAVAGVIPPWSAPGECSNVTARVTSTSPATFGPFTSGAELNIVIENRSSNSISVPAARNTTARGSTGRQYSPDDSLADQSWFFPIDVHTDSDATVQLGLASAQSGTDDVTVVIPGVRGSDWFSSRCRVTLDPIEVAFAR